ncbi:hypothetical protein AABB24_015758 [Solanum stoloniferum]|uniref:Uncharacterized protein n=1 Tax=Solanum stoloniferum TaxID=62892 RepID=A0ABD2TTT4_9SOLN
MLDTSVVFFILNLLSLQIQDAACSKVRSILTPLTVQLALQRILSFPSLKQYTVVVLMFQASCMKRLKSLMQSVPKSYSRDANDSLMKEKYKEILRERTTSQSYIDQSETYYQAARGENKRRI